MFSCLQVWQTSSGHLLAECHINGKRAGWMILDTGASGFVIEPSVADQYQLPMFGDLRIAGVAGKVSFVVHDSVAHITVVGFGRDAMVV
jgi:predicted aspartyl protease